jgi:hypothetical protein
MYHCRLNLVTALTIMMGQAVEDHGSGDLSLSSIGFEDDDLDDISVNGASIVVDDRSRDFDDSPVLYIAAARSSRISSGRRRRKKKGYTKDNISEASSASVLWRSVGKYLNTNNKGRRGGQTRTRRTIIEKPGGREGDYWGAYPSNIRIPRRFSRKWLADDEEYDTMREGMEEVYEESLNGASSKGEPVYR